MSSMNILYKKTYDFGNGRVISAVLFPERRIGFKENEVRQIFGVNGNCTFESFGDGYIDAQHLLESVTEPPKKAALHCFINDVVKPDIEKKFPAKLDAEEMVEGILQVLNKGIEDLKKSVSLALEKQREMEQAQVVEDQCTQVMNKGWNIPEIAHHLGCSYIEVTQALHGLGLINNPRLRTPSEKATGLYVIRPYLGQNGRAMSFRIEWKPQVVDLLSTQI